MKYKLLKEQVKGFSPKVQILLNRGMHLKDIPHYFKLSDADINPPETFDEELMMVVAQCFLKHLDADSNICVVIDADCDGYTSSAVLINYIYELKSKEYINNHVSWYMHEGKQHGLSDCFDWIENMSPDLVLVPDAGTNDVELLQKLENKGIDVIILDHHEIEELDYWRTVWHPHLYLINSQLPQYPNKSLSGVGVVWQFCRMVSKVRGLEDKNIEDWYLDLVALGLTGDMMSLQSFETRYLIFKGLKPDNIRNPFIYEMWQKNKFKLGDNPTSWGITFYIVPFVNAITRSGTMEEKELIFNSMLRFKAFDEIPSNKRGHKVGEMERVVDQAIRTCTNVKNRQTRAEDAGIELVKGLIEKNNMMEHKVLLFLLEPGQIKPEIRGLIANKLMAKYQRPCCMLTKVIDDDGRITYQGSARGCDKVGVTEFKDICAATGACDYTVGHQGAFGLGITTHYPDESDEVDGENLYQFIEKTDKILANMPNEPIYYVDYIWDYKDVDGDAIIEIAEMAPYWGKDVDEALVAIKGIRITKDMLHMMASNTMKISLPNNINIIKFRTPDEEFNKLYSENGYVEIDAICTANINEWNGNRYPQLFLIDYNIIGRCAYVF